MTAANPLYLQNKIYPATRDRQLIKDIFGAERVLSGLAATYGGTGLNVSVAAGACLVQGDTNANQGLYEFFNDAAATLTHDAADGTNPRVDRIIARVYDASETGAGSDAGALEIVKGTPSSGAAMFNQASWPALPASAMEIAVVLISTGATSITQAEILDRRPKLSGRSLIAATETRTNTSYGLLPTPDIVRSLIVPQDSLVAVTFQGTWQESVAGAARAAIFVGSNQLQAASGGGGAPNAGLAEAILNSSSGGGIDYPFSTVPWGLNCGTTGGGTTYSGDVNTGQAVASRHYSDSDMVGGRCEIFGLAAGVYDISIQYKASSGSVTAKNRKLWVRVEDPGGPHGGRW